jgi:hypothetical protein
MNSPMSWKEKVENNFTIFVLGLLVTGFAAGIGAYKLLVEMTAQPPSQSAAPSGLRWAEEAKKQDWVPKKECPAYPVSINITSPGSGSIVEKTDHVYYNSIGADLVVQASRPIPTPAQVSIVANRPATRTTT